jgi:hypothetical protein
MQKKLLAGMQGGGLLLYVLLCEEIDLQQMVYENANFFRAHV